MSTVDSAFEGAGQAPGVELWRIEAMKPVAQPFNGKLHTGDAYILLATTAKGKDGIGGLQWNLHFWLGAESSQDEQGVAAYKAAELDDALGGAPVQYREVEGHESPLFLSYFKTNGLEILPGGVASGFNKVERDVYRTRLLHLKGARTVWAKEVPLVAASLCVDDAFLLDAGLTLYLWHGPEASRKECAKALEMALRIRDGERGGKPSLVLVEEANAAEADAFWGLLGGKAEVTQRATQGDAEAEAAAAGQVRLRRVSDASGTLEVEEVAPGRQGRLEREMLDSKDVFILDVGSEVFMWVGKGTTAAEKKCGMRLAVSFLEQSGRALASTPITRVVEHAETAAFKAHFATWDPPIVPVFGHRKSVGVAASAEGEAASQVDAAAVAALLGERVAAEEASAVGADEGSGEVKVWRIEQLQKVEVPAERHGHFYGGDSYVVLYTAKDAQAIYIWQGSASSTDEKGASALYAVELDDQLGGKPVQVRVVQGKEPAHFRRIFKGRLVVHSGGVKSGFRRLSGSGGAGGGAEAGLDENKSIGPALFQVKGRTAEDTYAVQVDAAAGNLNSGDCFLLAVPEEETVFAWLGKGANAAEKEAATVLAECVKADPSHAVSVIEEGVNEPDSFWAALGGIATYPTTKAGEPAPREPRLFQVSNATGTMKVEEVPAFAQSDLADEDVMLLDTYITVFVWVGAGANAAERKEALRVAQAYIEQAAKVDGRDARTPVVKVAAGSEPPLFTQHFLGWDAGLAVRAGAFEDPYEARLKRLREEREAAKKQQQEQQPALRPVVATPSSAGKPEALAVGDGQEEHEQGEEGEPATPLPSSTAVSPASSARKSPTVSPTPSLSSARSAATAATPAVALAEDKEEKEAVSVSTPVPTPKKEATKKKEPEAKKEPEKAKPKASPIKPASSPAPSPSPSTPLPNKLKPKWPPSPASPAPAPAPAPKASAASPAAASASGIPAADPSDPSKRETLLSEKEFEAAFKMGKAEFYGLPLWRQRALKRQAGLF